MAEETPEFPGFERSGDEKVVLKGGKVSLSRVYKSSSEFIEIRHFYDSLLVPKGWRAEVPPSSIVVGEQKYVYYKRGAHSIGVMQVNGESDCFQIFFEWYAR